MEDEVSLFNESVSDEVDSLLEEIKDSVKADDEASSIVEDIKKSSEVKTAILESDSIFQVANATVSSSLYYKDELNEKFNDIHYDIENLQDELDLVDSYLLSLDEYLESVEEYQNNNEKIIAFIDGKIYSANAAIRRLENRAASIEHRQNNIFKENLALKDRLTAMKKRINITDIILAASIIAYTIRFLNLGF